MPAAAQSFDLVVIAEPRLRYADGRCLAALLATAAAHGYRTGLLPVLGALPSPGPPVHPQVAAVLARGDVALLDGDRPHDAGLALVYDLLSVRQPVERPWAVRPERLLLRIDQPWRALDGTPLLSLPQALKHAAGFCNVQPELACADPLLQERLSHEGFAGAVLWPPTSSLAAVEEAGQAARVGRHVGGGEGAWPAVAAHGGPVILAEAAARSAPPGGSWLLQPGELDDPAGFLASLGTYLLTADRHWRPVLLSGLAEVLATGTPMLAAPALEPLLGPAAAYAEAEDVPAAMASMTPDRRSTLRRAARELHATLTGPAALVTRLKEQLGPPRPHPPRLTLRRELRTRRRALFLSPNGIGMGHLTRLLAVARRLGPELEPVFLSMSQAVGVVEGMGYVGEYFPYHQHSGETADAWNAALRARLDEAIAFYDARCVVLDGNVPYQGLVECAAGHPNRSFVWIRRGLWREDAGRAALERARHFDLVIEPGEFAAELDRGPTVGRAEDVLRTAPVVFHDPSELLTRAAARSALGLDPERTAVLVQLGSRNNFDYASIDQTVLEELASRPEIEVVVLDWLIGEVEQKLPLHVHRLRAYPAAHYLNAFDFAISAAGYNSFHELMSHGVPSIVVPNENPMMDAQELRGVWAERQGLGYLVRRHDRYRAAWAIRALLEPENRAAIRRRCAALPPCDGAATIARSLETLAAATRLPARPDRIALALTRPG